ncbi:MAG: hypothetical protein KF862_07500 [Chitinophagaceae bacterium]|nr:hypothetical protein [Chitinophagaceae bacterium]
MQIVINLNLKNYTSEVPAITSMARIEKCLVEAGATDPVVMAGTLPIR